MFGLEHKWMDMELTREKANKMVVGLISKLCEPEIFHNAQIQAYLKKFRIPYIVGESIKPEENRARLH